MKCFAFVLTIFLSLQCFAQSKAFLSGGLTYQDYQITGSDYVSESFTKLSLVGDYSYLYKGKWRFLGSVSATIDTQTLMVATGVVYHLTELVPRVENVHESVEYSVVADWSPYLGVEFGLTRVQVSLERDNASQTDAVIGALAGPALVAGTTYALSGEFFLQGEFVIGYSFSPAIASNNTGIITKLMWMIP